MTEWADSVMERGFSTLNLLHSSEPGNDMFIELSREAQLVISTALNDRINLQK